MIFRSLIILLFLCLSVRLSAAADGGRCPEAKPFEIAAEDGFFPYTGVFEGQLRGFSLDIVTAAYDAVGCRAEFIQMPYNRCIREVQAGRHLGCFNTTNSDENLRKYVFHEMPLFRGRILIYGLPKPGGTPSFGPSAFHQDQFAVVRGYTYTDAFDNDPAIRKIEVESDLQTLALVARKRADYAVVYEKVAQFNIGTYRRQISPAPVAVHELVTFDLFVSFTRKDLDRSAALARLLDQGLRKIQANGVYGEIEADWDRWLEDGAGSGRPPPYWQSRS